MATAHEIKKLEGMPGFEMSTRNAQAKRALAGPPNLFYMETQSDI